MKLTQRLWRTTPQSFFKPYWLFGIVLTILIIFVTYLLVQVYRSSSLLAEANRLSFVQEAKTRLSILNEYFERLNSEVQILSNNRALHAYYQNKALGMSLEYGLAVTVAQIRDEFERFQESELAKKRLAFQQIALIDAKDMRVVAQTRASADEKWIDPTLIKKIADNASDKFTIFDAMQVGTEWAMIAVKPVFYKGEAKGYLLLRLNLKTLQDQLNVPQNTDFDGITNSRGILIVGPTELVGKDLFHIFAVSPSVLKDPRGIESQSHALMNVSGPLLVSGGRIIDTPFFLVTVAPSSTYLAGYSGGMWIMVFATLLTGLLTIVFAVSKSLLLQSRMYRQIEEARDTLEVRVRERTQELGETNSKLQGEIEERTRAQKALQASEERYRTLVEKALEGIVVAENGILRFVNRQGVEITGYDLEELLGKPFTDFIHPDHRQMVLERHYRRLKGEEFSSRYSFMIVTRDGSSRWVEIDSGLIVWEEKAAVLFSMNDITERKETEDQLEQSEKRYRSLYSLVRLMCDNVPDLIWAKDLEQRYLFVNRAVCEKLLIAQDTEEPLGKTDRFFSEKERERHPENPSWHTFGEIGVNWNAAGGSSPEPQRFDEFGNVQGEFLYLDVYKAPFWNEDARIIGTVGCARDVTRERSIEQSLRESEALYRDLFESASDLIYTHDLAGDFTSVSSAVLPLLGYTVEEFLTLNFRHVVDPRSLQITEQNLRNKVHGDAETTGPYEILAHAKGGLPVWLEVTSRLMKSDGVPEGVHGIARDVTKRKELEAAVLEAQMKYQSVVGAFDGLIHISSPNHEIEFANQRLIDRTGYNPVGQKCYEVVHGLSVVCPWCNHEMATIETYRRERLSPRDNRWYYVVSSPMVHQDGSISRIFLMQDIDEQKRSVDERENLKEQLVQAQKMEAVGTLAGGIAHDFNNLLQVVLGYSQLLLGRASPDSSQYDAIKKITVAARHAADLVKGLLAFSRKAVSRPRPLDLNYQVVEVKGLLERTIPKMIKIQLRLEEDLPIIQADPGQIEQILMNLGVNARDAMPEGGLLTIETGAVHVDLEFCRKHVDAAPGYYCMLAVSDTGQGMDKETIEHIFEPFYTTKDVGKGTGLGLAMVYGLVKQHHGFITCESWPEQGTSLKIYFPVVEKEKEELEQIDVAAAPGGDETLLIVDDEDVVRNLGADYLRQAGYTVLTASNGREALEIYLRRQSDISLVILDLIMPEMGGRRCFEELLKINPDVRVLIVSGYTSGGTEKDARELGARGFVGKPYDLSELLETIRHVLDQG